MKFTNILFALVWVVAFGCNNKIPSTDSVDTLPIYRLSAPDLDEGNILEMANKILGLSGSFDQKDQSLVLKDGQKTVELDKVGGGIWLADEAQMWNPDILPKLPDTSEAGKLAQSFLSQYKLLPQAGDDNPFLLKLSSYGGTYSATFDLDNKNRTNRQHDIQVNYSTIINVNRKDRKNLSLPVIGGGGEYNVTLGDGGSVIGYSSTWRPIEKVELHSPVVPKAKADAQFRELTKNLKILSFDSNLAYYSAPFSVKQDFLYPVYEYRAVAQMDDEKMPLRIITLPATEWGPALELQTAPLKRRTEKDFPQRRSTMPGEDEEIQFTPKGLSDTISLSLVAASWAEAGTSWIGESQGLPGSKKNAQGFIDELQADSWSINFNWGNENAWESDWRQNDDSWVDAADFVFYTGHASGSRWNLYSPDDNSLHFSELGASPASPGDLWGRQDLEWVIVAACGPLQDDVISSGGGDVFDRWEGAFDGLHQLLGYGAVTYDNETEGKTVVKYAKQGKTLINSWFRAAREIQPSSNGYSAPNGPAIWVGVMYVGRSGVTNPSNDHIHLHGSVAPDPTSPNYYVAMWSTT